MMLDENTSNNNGPLQITNESEGYLSEIRKWTTFFSVLGFIFIGLMILGALFMMVAFSKMAAPTPIPASLIGLIYLVLAAIYFFPVYYLLKFSNNMNKALKEKDSNSLDLSFMNLKSHFRFTGIFTIIMISVYILIILILLMSR